MPAIFIVIKCNIAIRAMSVFNTTSMPDKLFVAVLKFFNEIVRKRQKIKKKNTKTKFILAASKKTKALNAKSSNAMMHESKND